MTRDHALSLGCLSSAAAEHRKKVPESTATEKKFFESELKAQNVAAAEKRKEVSPWLAIMRQHLARKD